MGLVLFWLWVIAIVAARASVWIELASHFVWQGLIGGAILCAGWACLRRGLMCLLTLMPWCYLLWLFQPWSLWQTPSSEAPGLVGRLTVMSWNVLCVNENVAEIERVVEAHPVDVLILIEVRPNLFEQIPALDRLYRHRLAYPSWGGNGIAIFTNRDDIRLSRLDFGGKIMPSVVAQVSAGDQRLSVIGMHTWSPFPPQRAVPRDRQLSELVNWLEQQDQPVCVVGDLNITPWAPAFREMQQAGLVDSRCLGFGNSASWPAWLGPLGIPIDHALSFGNSRIVDRRLGPMVFGSDHRPVIIEIAY